MQLSFEQKNIIERVINCFETGSPEGNYAAIAIYADGPKDIKQITYGRSQTTEYGNLGELVRRYVAAQALYSNDFAPYAQQIGVVALTDNEDFKSLLRKAAKNDPAMRTIQDDFFDQLYLQPALKWCDNEQMSLPLSGLVVYDSFIHSGSILSKLRNMFAETTPKGGGSEQAWIRAYLVARNSWLENHSRPAVRASAYRTKNLLALVDAGNWELAQRPIIANGINVQ